MAAWVRSVNGGVRSQGSGTEVTVSSPSPTAGDLVLCFLLFNGGTGVTITPPADFTLVARDDSGTAIGMALYEGIAPIASFLFTITDEDFTVASLAIADADQLDAVRSSAIEDAASGTSVMAPGSLSIENGLLISTFGVDANTSFTGPSDMTEQRDSGQVGNPTVAIYSRPMLLASDDTTRAAVAGAAGVNIGSTIVVASSRRVREEFGVSMLLDGMGGESFV